MRVNHDYFRAREGCPVCGGTDIETLFAGAMDESPVRDLIASHFSRQGTIDWEMLAGTDFMLALCRACQTIYQAAEPNDAVLAAIYTRMIDAAFLDPFEQAQLTIGRFNEIAGELAILFAMTGKPAGNVTFLDYGAGYGSWARVARAMGATVYVTEIGEEKAAAAAALGLKVISDADIDTMRFDIVHTEQVFEHLTHPRETFARLAAATACVFKIAVPPQRNAANVLRRKGLATESPFGRMLAGSRRHRDDDVYMAVQPLEHLNLFSARAIEMLAAENSMRIVGRTRPRALQIDIGSPRELARSTARLAKSVAGRIVRRGSGYALLRPLHPAEQGIRETPSPKRPVPEGPSPS